MTKQAMSEGAWAANFGATKQAARLSRGEEREIFRIIEERDVPSLGDIERSHIADRSVGIGTIGETGSGHLAQGAQGKWASTLEKAGMFHLIHQ